MLEFCPLVHHMKLKSFRLSKKSLGIIVSAIFAAVLFLSIIPLSNAVFVRGGDFRITMSAPDNPVTEGDRARFVVFLINNTNIGQVIDFTGSCQATLKIVDQNGSTVYPALGDEFPCNNTSYEKFIMAPGQQKKYQFNIEEVDLDPGNYYVIGSVYSFGTTNPLAFTVLKKPILGVDEFELCDGVTGQMCKVGLVCAHRGGFTGGAGICLEESKNFEPVNRCNSGRGKCFADTVGHPQEKLIEEYGLSGYLDGDGDNFNPDGTIRRDEFVRMVENVSGVRVDIASGSNTISRGEAIKILYTVFISEKEPRNLGGSPFTDILNSPYFNYIDEAYEMGLISSSRENLFRPNDQLTRAHAVLLIDRFRKY